jgi:predicted nucleic acid-binding Zn ribbon protein
MDQLLAGAQPASGLGAVQRVWRDAVGEGISQEAQPTAERDGVLTVSCKSAAWASDLDLLAPELIEQLNALLGPGRIVRLRCIATTTRSWSAAHSQDY